MIVKLNGDFGFLEMALRGNHHVRFFFSAPLQHLRNLGELGIQLLLDLRGQFSLHAPVADLHGLTSVSFGPVADVSMGSAYLRDIWRRCGGSPGFLPTANVR